jgi:hypothetical protein
MAADLTPDEGGRYREYLMMMRETGQEPLDPVAWVTRLRESQNRSQSQQPRSPAADPAGANSSTSSVPQSLTINAERILKAICDCPGWSSKQIAAGLGFSLEDVRFIIIALLGGRVRQDAQGKWWPATDVASSRRTGMKNSEPAAAEASKVIAQTFLPGYEPPFLRSSASRATAATPRAARIKPAAPQKSTCTRRAETASNKPCKQCEICGHPAISGQRFCKECRKAKLAELKESGYLRPVPQGGKYRSIEQQENTYETKHGRDG